MIDLYLDKLEEKGVRYALWNILGYSHTTFSEAGDVVATLQMGENAIEGEIYEPSRASMVFPLKGDNLTKYIVYVDIKERKIIFLDANLYADVCSAIQNEHLMSDRMPKMLEYIDSLPTVYDLFRHGKKGDTPILYSDKETAIENKEAYVFLPSNEESSFSAINIEDLI